MRGFSSALLAFLFLSLIRPNAVGDPLGVRLVGAWLGEGNAEDFVGFADGTPSAGLTYVAGQFGQAFSFNGSSEVVLPDNAFDSLEGGARNHYRCVVEDHPRRRFHGCHVRGKLDAVF